MFIDNKYKRWHDSIIEHARSSGRSKKTDYFEAHHVIPMCMGGPEKGERVLLTAREHFVVHWLLTKCAEEKYVTSLRSAVSIFSMKGRGQERHLTPLEYEIVRRNVAAAQRELKAGDKHPFWGKKRPEHAAKMSTIMKGREFSESHKKAISDNWQQSRERVICAKCGKNTTKSMHTRWHGDKCGQPPDPKFIEKLRKPKTAEHRMNLSRATKAYYEARR